MLTVYAVVCWKVDPTAVNGEYPTILNNTVYTNQKQAIKVAKHQELASNIARFEVRTFTSK